MEGGSEEADQALLSVIESQLTGWEAQFQLT